MNNGNPSPKLRPWIFRFPGDPWSTFAILIAILGLFGITQITKTKKPQESNIKTPRNSTSDSIPSDTISYIPLSKVDTSFKYQDDLNEPSKKKTNFSSLKFEQKDDVDYYPIDFEVHENKKSGSEPDVSSSENLYMTLPPPESGFGKIVLRSHCDYCDITEVKCRIMTLDSFEISNKIIPTNYDPTNEWESSFMYDVLPGKYLVEFDYKVQGRGYLQATVLEGKASVYNFTKINPYGGRNGTLAFYFKQPGRRYDISIDNNEYGIFPVSGKRQAEFTISPGDHVYQVKQYTDKESLDRKIVGDNFYMRPGQRSEVNIY